MAQLLLFASAREAAGVGRDEVRGATVGEVLDTAADRYGDRFRAVLVHCRVWCNGEPAEASTVVTDRDEVAVLPPVSGGADGTRRFGLAASATTGGGAIEQAEGIVERVVR